MITVNNDRIRVTVTNEIWDSFADAAQRLAHRQILPSGDERVHSAEQIQRGLVLSEAMKMLGNTSELNFLENDELDSVEITKSTKLLLMANYLKQHGHYNNVDRVMMRYEGNHRMSRGVERDVLEAEAYAQGQLSPLSNQELMTSLINYVLECAAAGREPTYREIRFMGKLISLKSAGALDDEVVSVPSNRVVSLTAKIVQAMHSLRVIERHYRSAHGNNVEGWQIEVIGKMPEQIGMCRYAL